MEGDSYDEYSNLVPNYYDENGCPNVPIAYSGMTGRLGKEWKLIGTCSRNATGTFFLTKFKFTLFYDSVEINPTSEGGCIL